jgi:gliding motility associated protien GldN
MKRLSVLLSLLLAAIMLVPGEGFSQRKKAPPRKKNTTRKAPPATPTQPVVEAVAQAPAIDTAAYNDSMMRANIIPKIEPSKRPGSTVVGNLVTETVPLAYDNIRIDDQVYKQIVWRDLSVYEKMNQTFRYEGEDNDGSQTFFFILLQHIRDGDITAFDGSNDRFTTPLKLSDISKSMTGGATVISVPDIKNDPDGTKGLNRDTTIYEEFNVKAVVGYRVKEEIIFDRETSRMQFRTLGIAPLREKDFGGQKAFIPMFWIYYPDARPFLARHEAYNPRNMAMRMNWEEIFESRYYASTIYKSTVRNSIDKPLSYTITDPLLRLYEGEKIKEQIFNWEQDQWSY